MAKFRLINGHHAKGNRIWSVVKERDPQTKDVVNTIRPVIESDLDLARMFPNKFERTSDYEPADPGRLTRNEIDYRIKGTEFHPDQQSASVAVAEPPKKRKSIEDMWSEEDEEDEGGLAAVESELGEDVSYVFSEAESKMLLVFKSGNQYRVAKRTDPQKAITEPLTKKLVREWIKDYDPDAA